MTRAEYLAARGWTTKPGGPWFDPLRPVMVVEWEGEPRQVGHSTDEAITIQRARDAAEERALYCSVVAAGIRAGQSEHEADRAAVNAVYRFFNHYLKVTE